MRNPGPALDPEGVRLHLGMVGFALALVRCVTTVLAFWSVASVLVAVPVAALFRVQARAERIWRELDRRRAWHKTTGWAE